MGKAIILSGGGGTAGSDDTTAKAADVLAGASYLGADTDDEAGTGTMPNNGAVSESLDAGKSYTVPEGYHNGSGKVTANSLSSQTSANASSGDILSGKTAWVNGSQLTGSMPNRGAVSQALAAGGSYTIPAGYHNGSGKVAANSLASQTSATASAGNVVSPYTGYSNGSKISGNIVNRGQAQYGKDCCVSSGNLYIRYLPTGAYYSGGASWAPEARIGTSTLMNMLGIKPENLKSGVTIGNVTGTWEGWVDSTCTIYDNGTWGGGATGLSSGAMSGLQSTYPIITPNIKFTDYSTLHVQVFVSISYVGDDWWMESDIDEFYVWDANKKAWKYMGAFGPDAHKAGTFYKELTYDISGWDFRGVLKFENYSSKMTPGDSTPGETGISKIWMTK